MAASRVVRVVAVAAIVGAVLLAVVVRQVGETTHERPRFPSLAAHPDRTLHGTVAYVDDRGCVRVVAAAGRPSKEVLCLPAPTASAGVKTTDPQLVWLPDGRLAVTTFGAVMVKAAPPTLRAGRQWVVDVRRGVSEEVGAVAVPAQPDLTTRQTTRPDGARVVATSEASTGRITLELVDGTTTRTLLRAHGPGKYSYWLRSAFWEPGWRWIAADDGRLLVVTPGAHPRTRVLTELGAGQGLPSDPRYATFAITDADLLTAEPASAG